MKNEISIDKEKCVGCGLCKTACAACNIRIREKKAELFIKDCILCGHCVAVCPQKAIAMKDCETTEKNGETLLDPEQVLNVVRFRRTIRRFAPKEIPNEILAQILEAGRLTHTAKNAQDVSFAVIKEKLDFVEAIAVKRFKKIKPLANLLSPMARNVAVGKHFFFFNAPVAIVIFAKNKTNGILAAQNMEFVAEAQSLGVCYSGFFTTAVNSSCKLKKELKAPRGKKAAMTLVLGYPNITFLRSAPRKELDAWYL